MSFSKGSFSKSPRNDPPWPRQSPKGPPVSRLRVQEPPKISQIIGDVTVGDNNANTYVGTFNSHNKTSSYRHDEGQNSRDETTNAISTQAVKSIEVQDKQRSLTPASNDIGSQDENNVYQDAPSEDSPREVVKPPKRLTYRIRGIPREKSQTWLENALELHYLPDEKIMLEPRIKIVHSCERESESCAFLTVIGVPGFLKQLMERAAIDPTADESIFVQGFDDDLVIDCTFDGLTQVYNTKENLPILADIVAITGLDGHAWGSWRQRGEPGRMWLADFLEKEPDLDSCRTMIYGYNARLDCELSTIKNYAANLERSLTRVRRRVECSKGSSTPLNPNRTFFWGNISSRCGYHRMISTSLDSSLGNVSPTLYKAIYGFMFFGTPHRGLDTENFKIMQQDNHYIEANVLDSLSRDSPLLEDKLDTFKNCLKDRKVVSFFEERSTKSLSKVQGKWVREGPLKKICNEQYSTLGLGEQTEKKFGIDQDHSMMVKFSSKHNRTYLDVVDCLRELVEEAQSVVKERFSLQ